MTRRAAITAVLLAIAAAFLVGRATATTPYHYAPLPSSALRAVPTAIPSVTAGADEMEPVETARSAVVAASGAPPSPSASAHAASRPKPRPLAASVRRVLSVTATIRGVALSWYCLAGTSRCSRGYPAGGHYAAASPDLAYLRGHVIRVSVGGRSTTVTVVDCDCAAVRSLDLYAAAFDDLAPIGTGRLRGAVVAVLR